MNQRELDAIRARVEAASVEPWIAVKDPFNGDNWLIGAFIIGASVEDGVTYGVGVTTDHVHASDYDGDARTDAEFIAHAREDVPALLTYIAELQSGLVHQRMLQALYSCDEMIHRLAHDGQVPEEWRVTHELVAEAIGCAQQQEDRHDV